MVEWIEIVRFVGTLVGLPTLLGVGVLLVRLSWKLSRWHTRVEERSSQASQDRQEIKRELRRINGNVQRAHARLDTHVDNHPL